MRRRFFLGEDEYLVRITHANPKFGVEEHYGDVDKLRKFLDGTYANVLPGDTVEVLMPGMELV